MEAFDIMLAIHNVLRWVVLIAAVAAIGYAWHGVVSKREWTRGDKLRTVAYVASMHLQLLLGLILYVQSPLVQAAFDDPGGAMGETAHRFFFVEHISMMVLAVIFVQLGSTLSKRAETDAEKHKKAAIFFTIGFVFIMGGLHYIWAARPLFPGL